MTYLQFLLAEAMGLQANDPKVLAAVEALDRAKVIDHKEVVRRQIQMDPCKDRKALMRKYHVSMNFVYRSWRLMILDRDKLRHV